jgi:hypothetical protein
MAFPKGCEVEDFIDYLKTLTVEQLRSQLADAFWKGEISASSALFRAFYAKVRYDIGLITPPVQPSKLCCRCKAVIKDPVLAPDDNEKCEQCADPE